MKAMEKLGNRRGVSPVIATVILVAVTIMVAVAVAYWMGGISAQYTQFEKVEIQTGYSTIVYDATGILKGWNISLTLKNTGSATATLTHVFVNEIPVDKYVLTTTTDKLDFITGATPVGSGEIGVSFSATGLTLESGQSAEFFILIGEDSLGGHLSSGTTVNVKIHSAGGMDYIKLIKLV